MVESELGLIPKGWSVKELGRICEYLSRGLTPKYQEKSKTLVLNQKVNKGEVLEKQYFKYLKDGIKVPKEKFAKKFDIILNSLGQGTLGRVHYYLEGTSNVVVDQHMTIIRANQSLVSSNYLYLTMSSTKYKNIYENLISGSTGMIMLNISKVRKIKIVVPNIKILNNFSRIISEIYETKIRNTISNETLIKSRDTLLPKLMNGEIDVNEVKI
jgi:type I restriction enzyme S subunit